MLSGLKSPDVSTIQLQVCSQEEHGGSVSIPSFDKMDDCESWTVRKQEKRKMMLSRCGVANSMECTRVTNAVVIKLHHQTPLKD